MSSRVLLTSFGSKQQKRKKLYREKLYVLKALEFRSRNDSLKQIFKPSKYLTFWNFEIQKCFDNINHQTITQLTPLCAKYLFFLKQWLTAPILSSSKKGGKIITFMKPKVGVLESSIIGPGILNLVLDGIDDILSELQRNSKLSFRSILDNRAKNFLDKTSVSKPATRNCYDPKINISYLRYADDIIFYGFHKRDIFVSVQKEITMFLASKSLTIKSSTNSIFQFKPNSSFSFLSFQYFFTCRYQKKKLEKGKFTKKNYAPFNITESRFRTYVSPRIFATIDQNACKAFKH